VSTTIRLTRLGRKKRPFYRLIVTDSRNRRDGAYLANLGYYNPFTEPLEVNLHEDEILAWLRKGATVSSTARSLMKREGILLRWDMERQGLPATEIDAKVEAWKSAYDRRAESRAEAKAAAERKAAAEARRAAEETEEAERRAAAETAAAEEPAPAETAEEAAPAETAEEAAPAEAAAEEPAAEAADAPAEAVGDADEDDDKTKSEG
jgi:small subunit ribosomal protein S16